jgi:hypothetical protein
VSAVCIGLVLAAASLSAHHSSAGIDQTKSVTLNGTVKEFRWGNPHAWIDLDVPNAKGATDTWSLEMTSPTFLLRAGWKSSSLKAGDKVSVVARPMRDGSPGGLFVSVTLPDGRTLSQRGGGPGPAPASPAPTPPK